MVLHELVPVITNRPTGRRRGDGQTRGQLSFGAAKPTCPGLRDVTACNNATATGSTNALSGYMVSQAVCISRGLTQH